MQPPVGPSLQLLLCLTSVAGEVSIAAVRAAWDRWFSSERFRRKLGQFESRGWIERTTAGEHDIEGAVRLTEAGREAAMGGRNPDSCWEREWDGNWRIVFFDIPEAQRAVRTRLGRGLRRLGFGYLQNSVWVSPDPAVKITHLLRGLKLNVEVLSLMQARPCAGGTDTEIVEGAWDFARINRNYELYLEVLGERPLRTSGRSWNTWLEVEWKAWNRAVGDDPLLPQGLLPPGYRGREAWRRKLTGNKKLFAPGV